jgi:hypothetical protein
MTGAAVAAAREPTRSRIRPAPAPGRAAVRPRTPSVPTLRRCACGGSCPRCRARAAHPRLSINTPGDAFEREADRAADAAMSASPASASISPAPPALRRCACGGSCPSCKEKEEELRRDDAGGGGTPGFAPPAVHDVLASPGRPLAASTRSFMEDRFGADFSAVRVHDDARAADSARAVDAHAYTVGSSLVFASGRYAPGTPRGDRLLAHELAHTLQQGRAARRLQRAPGDPGGPAGTAPADELTGPLTDSEWRRVEMWRSYGLVGINELTGDPDHNATIIAASIFCSRMLGSDQRDREAPLMCVDDDLTRSDPRVQTLRAEVTARGPITHWAAVAEDDRILHVMEALVDTYHFPVNGAAGLVGNLWSESAVLPSRVEGSLMSSPMRAQDFSRTTRDFTAEEVMNRDLAARTGPRLPGVGLAQWTSPARRTGLFQHSFQGRQPGSSILFDMDAQVDYLVTELQGSYAGVYRTITRAGVSVDDAADEVVYRYEVPGAILSGGNLLPRTDARVQTVFRHRRANAQRALRVYRAAHP